MQRRIEKGRPAKRLSRFHPSRLWEKGKECTKVYADALWDLISEDLSSPRILAGKRLWSFLLCFCALSLFTLAGACAYPLSVHPIPFALLCAAGGYSIRRGSKELPGAFCAAFPIAGAFCACLFLQDGLLYAIVLLCTLLIRLGFSGPGLEEPLLLRVFVSVGASVVFSLGEMVLHPESADVLRLLALCFLSPLFTYLFCGAYVYFGARENKMETREGTFTLRLLQYDRKGYLAAAALSGAYCVLFALKDLDFLGLSPALILGALIALACARKRGALFGALFGLVSGLAASGNTAGVTLAFLGFFAGLFFSYSLLLGLGVSFALTCGYLFIFAPATSFSLYGADVVCAVVLFFPLGKGILRQREKQTKSGASQAAVTLLQKKLASLSAAFSSLSEVFYMATDKSVTDEFRLAARLTREATGRVCVRCKYSSDCWERNYGLTQSALTNLSDTLSQKRSVCPEDMEAYFRTRCVKKEALCAEINRRYALACGALDAPEAPASLLCGEYGSVSKLLQQTAVKLGEEERLHEEATAHAALVLQKLKIPYRSVRVTGGRALCVEVHGLCLPKLAVSTQLLIDAFSEELSASFADPEFLPPLDDATLVLRRRRVLNLEAARVVRAKGGESVAGDTAGFFESENEYFYSLICDGMGSGRSAAFVSRLSSIFIEKLLTFSEEKGVTLEMLNRFLLSQNEERFSTVDLLEVDYFTGKANFIKAGASPSFVKRGTGLYRIESQTPPAGILQTPSAEQTSLSLVNGDQVVMFSDGVAGSADSFAWFAETLAFAKETRADLLAKYLIGQARTHHGGVIPDDMSVTVLNVKSA